MTKNDSPAASSTGEDNTCGLIMPISDCPPYRAGHWTNVRAIIEEAVKETGFGVKMVSEGTETHIIQRMIVHSIYNNEMVVCDVSSLNPNVMLELGLRLATRRPVIVVKDELTNYSFDASPIRHLGYPSDLRYTEIGDFKAELIKMINEARQDYNAGKYHSYFDTFGPLPQVKETERGAYEVLSGQMEDLRALIISNQTRDTIAPRGDFPIEETATTTLELPSHYGAEDALEFAGVAAKRLTHLPNLSLAYNYEKHPWRVTLMGPRNEVTRGAIVLRNWITRATASARKK